MEEMVHLPDKILARSLVTNGPRIIHSVKLMNGKDE